MQMYLVLGLLIFMIVMFFTQTSHIDNAYAP